MSLIRLIKKSPSNIIHGGKNIAPVIFFLSYNFFHDAIVTKSLGYRLIFIVITNDSAHYIILIEFKFFSCSSVVCPIASFRLIVSLVSRKTFSCHSLTILNITRSVFYVLLLFYSIICLFVQHISRYMANCDPDRKLNS